MTQPPAPRQNPELPARTAADEPYEVQFDLLSPKGFPVTVRHTVKGRPIVPVILQMDTEFETRGFKPRLPAAPAAASAGGAAGASDDTSWLPKFCPDCAQPSTSFYDNRNDPSRPPGGPDFKCRECKKGFWKDPPRGGNRRR